MSATFVLRPGSEVRLATDHPLSNGRLGRVVSIHKWGAVLETNFATHSYRAAWNEMEPVDVTELINPHQNGHQGSHYVNGKYGTIAEYEEEGTGNECPRCSSMKLQRKGGGCVKCKDCGYDAGCSG